MKLRLVFLGKTRSPDFRSLVEHYRERIGHFHPVDVVEKKSTYAGADLLEELRGKKGTARVVLLDDGGQSMNSEQFARWLDRELQSAPSELVFVGGGAEGFPEETKQAADDRLSLSPMTFPHELARVLLAEQIYRAFSILRNHPYSK